jgi:hypothetical protein
MRGSKENETMSLLRLALPLTLSLAFFAPGAARAQGTPDGVTPAVEDVCTGLLGAAYGLCVAYCEANDCDLYPDSHSCDVLRGNYAKVTGEMLFPCEIEEPPAEN